MPVVHSHDVTLYYEASGAGYPLLLLAPGGWNAGIDMWATVSPFNPITAFADTYRVLAVDQRTAGRSRAPLVAVGWDAFAADYLRLLDQLGIGRAHLLASSISVSVALALLAAAPERISAAVLVVPI